MAVSLGVMVKQTPLGTANLHTLSLATKVCMASAKAPICAISGGEINVLKNSSRLLASKMRGPGFRSHRQWKYMESNDALTHFTRSYGIGMKSCFTFSRIFSPLLYILHIRLCSSGGGTAPCHPVKVEPSMFKAKFVAATHRAFFITLSKFLFRSDFHVASLFSVALASLRRAWTIALDAATPRMWTTVLSFRWLGGFAQRRSETSLA